MKALSILALEETPEVGLKTIEKVLSIAPTFELSSPTDLRELTTNNLPSPILYTDLLIDNS